MDMEESIDVDPQMNGATENRATSAVAATAEAGESAVVSSSTAQIQLHNEEAATAGRDAAEGRAGQDIQNLTESEEHQQDADAGTIDVEEQNSLQELEPVEEHNELPAAVPGEEAAAGLEFADPLLLDEDEVMLGFEEDLPEPELHLDIDDNEDENLEPADQDNWMIREPPRNLMIPTDRMHAALRALIAQNRRRDGSGPAVLLSRDTFMQRLRRALFSLDRNRPANGGNGDDNDQVFDDNDMPAEGIDDLENEERIDEEEPENAISFDTNLPAEHSYLGSNMNRVSGVDYLDVGQRYKMLLFMHQHILFPGEVLPFMISGSMIEPDIDATNGLLFGVCFFCNLPESEQEEHLYGVTCQIYEKGTDARGNMLVKSRALQRFVTKKSELTGPLQYIASQPGLKCYGYVHILPEIFLPEPLKCINMGSMNRFRDIESMKQTYKRYQAATTPWQSHIYENYSITTIIEKARTQLAEHKIDTMPTDPTQLSFWLVRNLHLSEAMMKTIFMTDSVNMRMKLISSTFKKDAIYICRYCGNRIAKCSELFAMSKHGVQSQYCNSAGYIHETNTVYQLLRDAVVYSGEPCNEFSWFPGYQWHVVICKICSRHIGWEFKALEPNMVPKSFYGISSYSVRVTAVLTPPSDPRAVIYRNILRLAHREMQ